MKLYPIFVIVVLLTLPYTALGQRTLSPEITDMTWEKGFGVRLKLSNDSNYIFNVNELFHAKSRVLTSDRHVIYFPVGLGKSFIDQLKERDLRDTTVGQFQKPKHTTLWSAIHYQVGGGYVHFVNCLLYALETGSLRLDSPLMQRPETKWKPKPITESYKRTRKWTHYAPITQKEAIKEYKIKLKKNELRDLHGIPQDFIDLFLQTTDKKYQKLVNKKMLKDKAKIDLIRLLVASNYLGEVQIKYISNSVMAAITRYSVNQLPTVIIFEDFNAAVAMSLDESGYRVEKIVFQDYDSIDDSEENMRREKILAVIYNINEINRHVFQKSLQNYYRH